MKVISIIAIVMLCMFAFSCDKKTTEPTIYRGISGLAMQAGHLGAYISRVHVTLDDPYHYTETDANGRYNFPDLKPGSYNISFKRYGFQDSTTSVIVPENDSLRLSVYLNRLIPASGKAYFSPIISLNDWGNNPTTSCINYNDSLVIKSRYYQNIGFFAPSILHELKVTLAKPVSTGRIFLNENSDSYIDYSTGQGTIVELSKSTRMTGGYGQIEIIGLSMEDHIIEATYKYVILSDGADVQYDPINGDFIGHW